MARPPSPFLERKHGAAYLGTKTTDKVGFRGKYHAQETIADTAAYQTIALPIQLAAMTTSAADLMTSLVLGFAFKVIKWSFVTTTLGTGSGASQTLNLTIGSTAVGTTPSTLGLTLTGTNTLGKKTDASAVSGAQTGTATDTLSVKVAASGTIFTAGAGTLYITVQNLDKLALLTALRNMGIIG